VRHILVAHRRQFTGSVFAGVSMRIGAVGHDLGVLVGLQLRREFPNFFGWNVQRSGDMGLVVAFGRESLDNGDLFFVEFGFQVFRRDRAFHHCTPQ
jgi:hypothetical protein